MSQPPVGTPAGPPATAVRWVESALGAGWVVVAAAPLVGGISAALHVLEVAAGDARRRVVLRRFTNAAWNRIEPDLAAHEAANLELLRATAVRAPRLLAHDATGDRCGHPAVLMTHEPGRVVLSPAAVTGWYEQMAACLPAIHAVDAAGHLWEYATWYDLAKFSPPPWTERPALWERVGEVVTGPAPAAPVGFIHRDYHPANILWSGGEVSAVVDWVNSCLGPPGIDVGWMRRNLAHFLGGDAPDRFLSAYLAASGTTDHHPYWDLITAIEVLPGPDVYRPFVELGVGGLTDPVVRGRFEDHVAAAVARL